VEAATIRVFSSPEFLTAIVVGSIILAAGMIASLLLRRRAMPIAGVLIAGGFLTALSISYEVTPAVWAGSGLLVAAGLLGSWSRLGRVLGFLLAFGGAWVISVAVRDANPSGRLPVGELVPWSPWYVLVGIPLIGVLISDFDRRNGGPSVPLLGITVLGLFFLVPDTELALVLLGVALPAVLLGWPWPAARLGSPGAYAVTGVLLWAAAIDGRGIPATLIVVVACFGLLVIEPLVRLAMRSRHRHQPPRWFLPTAVIQLATAAASSRLLPTGVTLAQAAVFTAGLLIASGALFILLLLVLSKVGRDRSAQLPTGR